MAFRRNAEVFDPSDFVGEVARRMGLRIASRRAVPTFAPAEPFTHTRKQIAGLFLDQITRTDDGDNISFTYPSGLVVGRIVRRSDAPSELMVYLETESTPLGTICRGTHKNYSWVINKSIASILDIDPKIYGELIRYMQISGEADDLEDCFMQMVEAFDAIKIRKVTGK